MSQDGLPIIFVMKHNPLAYDINYMTKQCSTPAYVAACSKSNVKSLMSHPLCNVRLDQVPILDLTSLTKSLTEDQHGDEDRTGGKADETSRYKTVLQPQIVNPRCNTITCVVELAEEEPKLHPEKLDNQLTNGKTHGVPDDDDCSHAIRTHLLITINKIVNTESYPTCVCKRQHAHSPNKAEPMYFVGCTDPPDNQGDRNHNCGNGEGPKTLFGFHDTTVASGEADRQPITQSSSKDCPKRRYRLVGEAL